MQRELRIGKQLEALSAVLAELDSSVCGDVDESNMLKEEDSSFCRHERKIESNTTIPSADELNTDGIIAAIGRLEESVGEIYPESTRFVLKKQMGHHYNEDGSVILPLVSEYLMKAGYTNTATSIMRNLNREVDPSAEEISRKVSLLNKLETEESSTTDFSLTNMLTELGLDSDSEARSLCRELRLRSHLSNKSINTINTIKVWRATHLISDDEIIKFMDEELKPAPTKMYELRNKLRRMAMSKLWSPDLETPTLSVVHKVYKELMDEVKNVHPLGIGFEDGFLLETPLSLSSELNFHPNFVCPILRSSQKPEDCVALSCGHLVSDEAFVMSMKNEVHKCPLCSRVITEVTKITAFL